MTDNTPEDPAITALVDAEREPRRPLSPEAERALSEARERRAKLDAERAASGTGAKPVEVGGRSGPDPVRYGDWENGGIASDF